jgi:TRAP transporter TAXI family solute receptor
VASVQRMHWDNGTMARAFSSSGTKKRVIWIIAGLLLAASLWVLLWRVSPSPPRSIVMTTGVMDGAYHQQAVKYRAFLAANGVDLVLKASAGSVENLKRLEAGQAAVGMVQGGLGVLATHPNAEDDQTQLRSLATVGHEPVWIFSRGLDLKLGLGALEGKRVGIGLPDSGSRKVALELLGVFGLADTEGRALKQTKFTEDGGMAAAKKLQSNELDAVILVAGPIAQAVQALLRDASVDLASMTLTEGLTRRLPHFQPLVLKQGAVDPQRNLPAQDVRLLATLSNLVVREDLHPALAYLLLEAARHVHARPNLFARPNEFPSPQGVDFPLAEEADRYFKSGRPLLQRYLPFWAANFVQRLVLILIPLVAILFPLLKLLPAFIAWRHERIIFKHYGDLMLIERELDAAVLAGATQEPGLKKLTELESIIEQMEPPVDVRDRAYDLRQHIQWVRSRFHSRSPAP